MIQIQPDNFSSALRPHTEQLLGVSVPQVAADVVMVKAKLPNKRQEGVRV